MFLLMMMVITNSAAFSPGSLQHGQHKRFIALSSTSMKALAVSQQRREFLKNAVAASTLATIVTSPLYPAHAATAASAITPKDARTQFDACVADTDKLLKEWDEITKGGGDAIRQKLGTNGPGSPFYQISKAVKVLLNEAEDPVAFGDASEQFEIRRAAADAMAYSALFTGGSGKPTPPEVYYKKSKVEVEALRRVEADMIEAL